MSFADDTISALEGELSKRVVFPLLGVDARGVFDRFSAEFNQAEGTAIVAQKSSLSMAFSRIKDVFASIKGTTVRVYDPEGIGDDTDFATFKAMSPQKYENLTVEIGLEA